MKKILMILFLLCFPFFVKADSNAVNVYVFVTDDCKTCDIALNYFDKYEENIKNNINIKTFNIIDKKNNKLLKEIIKLRNDNTEYVPYIVIGNKSWEGINETYSDSIKEKIIEELKINPEDRYDIMQYVSITEDKEISNNNIIPTFLIILNLTLFMILIIKVRKRA